MLLQFIDKQISTESSSFGKSGPLVVHNIFRALQSDIFTACAFSDKAAVWEMIWFDLIKDL